MPESVLVTADELGWLKEVHKIEVPDGGLAILWGNEDAPDRVDVYRENHVDAMIAYYTWEGEAHETLTKHDPDTDHSAI